MTNQKYLWERQNGLPFKRQGTVDQYLIGILSVVVDEAAWQRAVAHAVEMEARTHKLSEQQTEEVSR